MPNNTPINPTPMQTPNAGELSPSTRAYLEQLGIERWQLARRIAEIDAITSNLHAVARGERIGPRD